MVRLWVSSSMVEQLTLNQLVQGSSPCLPIYLSLIFVSRITYSNLNLFFVVSLSKTLPFLPISLKKKESKSRYRFKSRKITGRNFLGLGSFSLSP
jgi:hypothetical protein